ncbi:TetR/AcrR family transcriptional regulator [Arthrobacter sp. JSM 101049]|uniref:TetR/AcrR family transcriptional regulator n=1 Tax=Arthrobacter sp. JSM 101049 TaxID=929097 RepID=UPI0035654C26
MNSSDTSAGDAPALAGDGRSARWDAHRQSRRTELVKAARSVIHRLGPGASMDDCAAAAGTSKSVFYRYFGDKDGLRRAMGEIVIGQMRTKVVDAARAATSEEAGLRAMVRAYLHMAQTSPNVYFFVTGTPPEPPSPAAQPAGEPLDDFFAELTSMMTDRMHAYLQNRGGGTAVNPALDLWPRAAIGMVRAAGETWLRTPDSPLKPSEDALTLTITGWLVSGMAGDPHGGNRRQRRRDTETPA